MTLFSSSDSPKQPTYVSGPRPGTVQSPAGVVLIVPTGWVLLPPGDAGLTRRVKADGEFWAVAEKRGRRVFSQGIYAPAAVIEKIRSALLAERSTNSYVRKRQGEVARREKAQAGYVEDFTQSVIDFLAVHPAHSEMAKQMAGVVSAHATPVGSGTVARTQMIPIERRAEAAVIAWMRHQTTAYDHMFIPRVKGMRREVRRMLAQRSREVLAYYRRGDSPTPSCPLVMALLGA